MTVVHVTHRREEVAAADRSFRLASGVLVDERSQPGRGASIPRTVTADHAGRRSDRSSGRCDPPTGRSFLSEARQLELRGVQHTYGAGHAVGPAGPARHRSGHRPSGGGADRRRERLRKVHAGLDHGRCAPPVARRGPARRPARHRTGGIGGSGLPARPPAAAAGHGGGRSAGRRSCRRRCGRARPWRRSASTSAEIGDRRIDELSGGQQRRVALAGILARQPKVLVLDEPLAGLDQPSQEGLVGLLADLRARSGLTVVVISHDLEGMDRVCDRVVRLDARPGGRRRAPGWWRRVDRSRLGATHPGGGPTAPVLVGAGPDPRMQVVTGC